MILMLGLYRVVPPPSPPSPTQLADPVPVSADPRTYRLLIVDFSEMNGPIR